MLFFVIFVLIILNFRNTSLKLNLEQARLDLIFNNYNNNKSNEFNQNSKSSQTPKSKQTFVLNKKNKKKKEVNGDQPGRVRHNTSLSLFLFGSPLKTKEIEREKK